jgi:type 2 lantibiotic biosynthesis protein LanM
MIPTPSKTTTTQSDISQIVSQASFLFERLSDEHIQENFTQVNEEEANTRLAHWCKVVAQGDWEKFQKRLEWDGWNIERVRQVLGTVPVLDSQALPNWATTLTEIVQTVSEFSLNDISPSPIAPENPYPFEDALLPLIFVARQKLLKRLGSASLSPDYLPLKVLIEPAYLSMEEALLKRLSDISAKVLEFEFSHSRPLGQSLLNLVIKKTEGTSSKSLYNAFVQRLLSDGMLAFFQKYPVLGRLIATAIDFWVEATGEFLERLNTDLSLIQQAFNPSESLEGQMISNEPGKVIEIKSTLSDLHNQGRSVIALTFESSLKVIYKPKNLGLEVTYGQLLEWCNENFSSEITQGFDHLALPFKVIKILNQGTYGWVEYVEQQPCQEEGAAQRFYTRAGMLVCLLYILGGNDCHSDNLIACGEHFVLVDMETVMQHEASLMIDVLDESAFLVARNQLFDSVLRTGLLPMWQFGVNTSLAYDLSALGNVDIQPVPIPMPVWRFINTDDMQQGYEKIHRHLAANIPVLNGVALSPNNYIHELVTGFEQMYRFLMKQRKALLAPDSPLAAFGSQQVRFLFRPTKVYSRVLYKAMAPEFLRHGLSWSMEVDILSRAFLTAEDKPQAWQILSAELKAMGQWDIPYFSATADSDALPLSPEQIIPEYFKAPCLSKALTKLQQLDETDLAQQVAIIQLAFYARVARAEPTALGNSTAGDIGKYPTSLLTSEQLLQQAQNIAVEIQDRAITGADGSLSWINLTFVPSALRFQVMPLGYSLYDGNCGIALFLAALAKVTHNTQFRDLALRAIQPLQKFLQTSDTQTAQSAAKDMGIGGGAGVASIIYSLVKISQFLELPQLYEDAQTAANLMTRELIAADDKFELLWGSAGAILGLLALYQKTENSAVLERAITCGQHLLDYCHQAYILKTATPKPMTGFSHGAAGIAYSLLRLYAVTQDSAYLDAARNAIVYEDSFFNPTALNWQEASVVYESASPSAFWSSWCHGAPGIGLGRLGGVSIYQTEQILTDIEVALRTTHKTGLQDVDHLCCGNLGRTEVFLVAGQKLNSPQWYQTARELAAMVVQRATQTGKYQLFGGMPDSVFSPCFFQGSAGIGYQLLRLAYPEALPSVLLWE